MNPRPGIGVDGRLGPFTCSGRRTAPYDWVTSTS
jgi:hypothetical protein